MHRRIGRIEGRGRMQFVESCRLILQFVPNGAQSVVGLRPFWTEFCGRLELLQGFPVLSFIFQRQRKVVVSQGVLGIQAQTFTISSDCFVPRFGLCQLGRAFAVLGRGLGGCGRGQQKQKGKSQQ